jgi:nicotinate-nucleotide adenylyltransferase
VKRIGIFAGTFDPVHQGHLAFSQAALRQCDLQKVYFLPERFPRAKQAVTAIRHRVAMLELAQKDLPDQGTIVLNEDQFKVASTLPMLQAQFSDARLVLLLGSDVVCHSLPHWDGLDSLLHQTDLAIAVRGTDSVNQVRDTLSSLMKSHAPFGYEIVSTHHDALSSSQTRASGAGLSGEMIAYIKAHDLYAI